MITERITILNEVFELHPYGAIYWERQQKLLIADVHLGKVSHFRKYGSAVPSALIHKNFELLEDIVAHYKPKTICFLGDLFHSTLNNEWNYFSEWVKSLTAKVSLIVGNHDIISPLKYEDLGITLTHSLQVGSFFMTHYPEERTGLYNFSGHLHPGVQLHGLGKQTLKVPCFYRTQAQLVLPAFGTFTGLFIISPKKGDTIYATTKEAIILIRNDNIT